MKKIIILFVFTTLNYYINGQVVKLTSGATLEAIGGVVVTLDNLNLEIDGTLNYGIGGGRLVFSGNQNTTISGTSVLYFGDIEMAKMVGAELSLMRSINMANQGNIHFTSGLLNLNNNSINLSPYSKLYNESETSRVYGTNGGYIQILHPFASPPNTAENPGNLGVIISTSQGSGTIIIRRGHQSQPVPTAGSILRYYDIIPGSNSSLNSSFRLHYFDAELNGLNENTMVIWKSSDNINWTNQGYTFRNTIDNYVDNSGADFSRWTLSAPYAARPVTSVNSRQNTSKITGNDINAPDIWRAWPNPAYQTLFLNIIVSNQSKAVIKISDSKGALIAIHNYYLRQGSNQLSIDVKKLAAGVYHIHGEWENGKTQKFVRLVKL